MGEHELGATVDGARRCGEYRCEGPYEALRQDLESEAELCIRGSQKMAIEFLVMPLSRYLVGDFVTPAMTSAWERGTSYKCICAEGPLDIKEDVPWGGGSASHQRGRLYPVLDGWLRNLPSPIPANLWDERSEKPARFHRLEAATGAGAIAYTSLEKQVAGYRLTGKPLFGVELPRGTGVAHSGASVFLPCEFAHPFEMVAPLKRVTGSAVLALRELENGACSSHASGPRDVLVAALRDALDLRLPLILIEVEDEAKRPTAPADMPGGGPDSSRALRLVPSPFPGLSEAVWQETQLRVAAGYDNRASLLLRLFETMGEELGLGEGVRDIEQLDEGTRTLLEESIERAFSSRSEAAQSWPRETDCDRLRRAFDTLARRGIVALDRCGFTLQDGFVRAAHVASVRDRLDEKANDGYCFCHDQDITHALEGHGLHLAFGAFRDEAGAHTREVGEAVVRACLDEGLEVDWNLSPDTRIGLPKFCWQRRLVCAAESDVRGFFESWEAEIRGGYTAADTVLSVLEERAGDWFADFADFGPALLQRLRAHTEAFLDAERQREATWSEPTMNDRITAAFVELNRCGVLASECPGLSTLDGWGYVGLHAKASHHGVVFFSREDVVDGLDGLGLFLAFGAVGVQRSEDDAATQRLGHEIVALLSRYGVPVTWSGSIHERIRLTPFEWRKRRWTSAPPPVGAPIVQKSPSVWSRLFGRRLSRGSAAVPLAQAKKSGVVVTAVRDENRFDLRLSRKMRAAWKALGGQGEGQIGHLGDPPLFVRAGELMTIVPCAAGENLREQKEAVFLRAAKIAASAPDA